VDVLKHVKFLRYSLKQNECTVGNVISDIVIIDLHSSPVKLLEFPTCFYIGKSKVLSDI
jgi:hypothetical protein